MRVYVIDPDGEVLETLASRVREALRQTGLKRIEMLSGSLDILYNSPPTDDVCIGVLGPGCYQDAASQIVNFRSILPTSPLALVLDNSTYASEAVELRREVGARVMPIGDIVQLVQFFLDAESQNSGANPVRRGVLAVTHFKGGVGATTIAAGFASVWARHGMSVVLVDFDDVNPQLTAWGRVSGLKRELFGELLAEGFVPKTRVNELVHPVEGYDGKLTLVGQPEMYHTAFHLKADVIEGAPSSADFVESLIELLRDEFDLVIVDTGRSWGIATFALLPLVQQVLLVLDDDAMSVRRTLDCLKRLYAESEDVSEFNLGRWKVLLNGYTGKLLTPNDVGRELEDTALFPESSELFSLPFSEAGRQWGAPGRSFYDCADEGTKFMMRDIAFRLFPFKQAKAPEGFFSKLRAGVSKYL